MLKFSACSLLLLWLGTVVCQYADENSASNETSYRYYNIGIVKGIINPEKYSFASFLADEQNVFKDMFQEYASFDDSHPVNYEEWLVTNNFGILPDTQESLFKRKITKRSIADNKRKFVNTVRKGDILIAGKGIGGLLGHAAIMSSNYYVLEMPGGKGWQHGIKDNNRQISKYKWFDEHQHDWTTVYRCPDAKAAEGAAVWADHKYYNPSGGSKKTKHIKYAITKDVWSINPSYCSKLVLQAYYFGTGKKNVINAEAMKVLRIIVPTQIPKYFMPKYRLQNKGKF